MVTRRAVLAAGGSVLGVSIAGCLDGSAEADEGAQFAAATTYLDPDCGCCDLHADYLESADADVEVVELSSDNLAAMKAELGIPSDLQSCHTTELSEGYAIEGHVPVDVINEVVEREPSAVVVGLPGMPSGSPGMPGSKDEEWAFYAIDEDGAVEEFTRR